MVHLLRTLIIILTLGGSTALAQNGPRILAMGDSFFVTHSSKKRAIPDVLSQLLNEPVKNRAVSGARIIYKLPITGSFGFNISRQFRKGNWDWIILNGGGNDLWMGCGCHRCDAKMDRLISRDGTGGEIPKLVARLRATQARIVYVGYLRSPGAWSPIEGCRDDGDELDARIARLAARDNGIWFVSLADLVQPGDRSFHNPDMVHPSLKATAAAAQRVAKIISPRR